MPLIYITGIAGAGKSAVLEELKLRGFEAYGVDENGFARWHNNQTGYVHPKSSVKTEQRTPDFINNHTWKISRAMVEALVSKAKSKPVFLCGVASNENELGDLFSKKFALIVDDDTLRHRIATRTGNDYGKTPHEFKKVLEHQAHNEARYSSSGYILVNATQPVKTVTDSILASSGV